MDTRPVEPLPAGPDQESVWSYPRPPIVEPVSKRIRVEFSGIDVADSMHAWRVIETASPPVYYIPRSDVRMDCLSPTDRRTFCEWKGAAAYWTVRAGDKMAPNAAWSYSEPSNGFHKIRDCFAFYPSLMDACWVDEVRALPQPGRFYGGWITPDIVGPFKGEPGSEGW